MVKQHDVYCRPSTDCSIFSRQIFCLVCLNGFGDTTELRQHMTSEHLSEDASEEGDDAEGARAAGQSAGPSSPPPAGRGAAAAPRKRPTLADISARLLAGSQLRAAASPPAEATSDREKLHAPTEGDRDSALEVGEHGAAAAPERDA